MAAPSLAVVGQRPGRTRVRLHAWVSRESHLGQQGIPLSSRAVAATTAPAVLSGIDQVHRLFKGGVGAVTARGSAASLGAPGHREVRS